MAEEGTLGLFGGGWMARVLMPARRNPGVCVRTGLYKAWEGVVAEVVGGVRPNGPGGGGMGQGE